MVATNRSELVEPDDLKGNRALGLLVHEKWLFGECRGQAERLYIQLNESSWVAITPTTRAACWVLSGSDSKEPHSTASDSDAHYRVRDIGAQYKLNGQYIDSVAQKRLSDRIEICIEFANATDLTLHYNLITQESSLYFIKG